MLADFELRQKHRELQRKKRMEALRKAADAPHKPKLAPGTKRIMQTDSSSFLKRLARDAMRKKKNELRTQTQAAHDPECTFRPQILESSRARPARSVVEMSRGDMLRKVTAQRMMKLKAEQDELSGVTFRPRLNRRSLDAESRLKVASEPESYIERLRREQQLAEQKRQRALEQQEMEEIKECTFRPEVHRAPEYVTRIARSMELTRAARKKAVKKTRPAWQ